MNTLRIAQPVLEQLWRHPQQALTTEIGGIGVSLHVAIPNFDQELKAFYGPNILPDFATAEERSGIACHSKHFGLVIRFERPAVLNMHDENLELLGDSKALIAQFETVILHNAQVDEGSRHIGHRNRFPHLNFHRDRNEHQPTPYSLYSRDPSDPEQCHPRVSSTLFTSNLVGYLQCMRERNYAHIKTKGAQPHYTIFQQENMSEVIGKVVLEHRWDEPFGVGEISMLDNRKSLHASYFRQPHTQGYRIGVRYLC